MISDGYSFNEFVDRVIDNTPDQVRVLALEERVEVRYRLKSRQNSPDIEGCGRRYDQLLAALACLIRHGGKPVDLDKCESEAFQRLCEAWVDSLRKAAGNPEYRNS